jgi:glycerate 2-kinase
LTDEYANCALLLALWRAGLDAVQPDYCLPPHLPRDRPAGRQLLFALGKAAASMAETALRSIHIDGGLIIAPNGTRFPDQPVSMEDGKLLCITAGHPVPDAGSLAAGEAAIALVSSLAPADRLIALISGGGSALMVAPSGGLSLDDKIALTRRMLASGEPIASINRERARLSRVKGGGLARLSGTDDIRTIVMSDVPGDDLTLVASGPTITDGRDNMARCADADRMLAAIEAAATAHGIVVRNLGGAIEGDAVQLARDHAAMALAARDAGQSVLILSGGEASVRVDHPQEAGGRNLTYALALAAALDGTDAIVALAADSDGIDGNSPAAGALIDGYSAARLRAAGWYPDDVLRLNRSFDALDAVGATLITGPTGVNVNDVRMIYVRGGPVGFSDD